MSYDRWDRRPYLQRLGDVVSQFFNVLLANGMPDESLSGRSYRNTTVRRRTGQPVSLRWWIVRGLAETLFWPLDKGNHCESAFLQDVERSRLRAKFITG